MGIIRSVALRGALRIVAVTGVAFGAAAAPATAESATSSVTMFSDTGDYIGQGQQRLFSTRDSTITVTGDRRALSVDVSGGTSGDSYTLQFAATPGHRLRRGVYDYAQRAPFRQAGRPGIDIDGDGRGCNTIAGRFEVRDIAATKAGAIKRLWLVYEQHCEGGLPALFGEVRIREGHRAAVPALVRWPEGDRGRAGTAVPVTVAASRAHSFGAARLVGRGRHAFHIRLDECRGTTVPAGSACRVWVRFRAGAGTHRAKLRIPTGGAHHYGAALQGFNWGGRTRAVLHSDKGDFVGLGRDWSYTTRRSLIAAGGSRQHASFGVTAPNLDSWSGDFSPASGDILSSGTTYRGAARDPFRGPAPGLEVDGGGRGCNVIKGRFTVTDARFDPYGSLLHFGVRFTQHCEGADPALHGEFDWRAGDRTKQPPWMGRIAG
jgi:hypothetical protein